MAIKQDNICSKLLKIWASTIYISLLVACQGLPKNPHLPKNSLDYQPHTLKNATSESAFLQNIKQQSAQHPNLSGYRLIASGSDAFSTRTLLTQSAQKSIDIQYYIWHDDTTGIFLLKQLWAAAERGVMVRLLLDDFNSSPSRDRILTAFASHPNISVRVANPLVYRKYRKLNFVTRPRQSQTRMHNKSMTFDNVVSIVGGRNIGDEYLNSNQKRRFADLDVLVAGQVIDDIKTSFESYWQSNLSFDIQVLTQNKYSPTAFNFTLNPNEISTYQIATQNSSMTTLIQNVMPLRWARMYFLADDVKKLSGNADENGLLVTQLRNMLPAPKKRLSIISSYFAPTKKGVKILKQLSENGVQISILTNAYTATDVRLVHMGYGHWRKDLLKSGIQLYELKANADSLHQINKHNDKPSFMTKKSLHAKAFAIDNQAVFIGSYNIDPRSANINSELGMVIDDNMLAWHIHKALNNDIIKQNSPDILHQTYKVEINPSHQLQWRTIENNQEVIYTKEPKTSLINRTNIALLSLLPIDGFL